MRPAFECLDDINITTHYPGGIFLSPHISFAYLDDLSHSVMFIFLVKSDALRGLQISKRDSRPRVDS